MLNDRAIRAAKTGTHRAGDNLYLRVTAAGSKTFVARAYVNKKSKWVTLGKYPIMSLAEARERTYEVVRSLAEGGVETSNELRTVSDAFELYYAHLEKQYRRPQAALRMILVDILPHIGKKPLRQLTRAECTHVLQGIVDRGSPVAANRTLAVMHNGLSFCEQRGWISENPLHGVRRSSIGGKEKAKDRNLSFDELQDLMRLLGSQDNDMSEGTRWALRMIVLTGLRATEALNLSADGVVTTKAHRKLRVPLTPHVRALLKRRPELPRDHRVMSHALRRLGQTFTPHDLRRTFASRLSDIGILPHVIEKMLDHKMEGVMAVYNRAEYWPERVAAQRLWGFKVAALRRACREKTNDPAGAGK